MENCFSHTIHVNRLTDLYRLTVLLCVYELRLLIPKTRRILKVSVTNITDLLAAVEWQPSDGLNKSPSKLSNTDTVEPDNAERRGPNRKP